MKGYSLGLGLQHPKTCKFIYFAWLCTLVIGFGNFAIAQNTNTSCFAVVCSSNCSQILFPSDIPQYPTLERAFGSVPVGCGQENAFQILLSPIENYVDDIVVPSTVSNVSFTTFRSNDPDIPYSRPFLGQINPQNSTQLNLHLSHLTWYSSSLVCLQFISWPPLVSIHADDMVIDCSIPSIRYSKILLVSSTLSRETKVRVAESMIAENTTFYDILSIWLGVDAKLFSLSNSTLHMSIKVTAWTFDPSFNISSTLFHSSASFIMPYTRVLAPTLVRTAKPSRNTSSLQSRQSSFQSASAINRVTIDSSTFMSRLVIEADSLDLHFRNNTVYGESSSPNPYYASMSMSLFASCIVRGKIENNHFMSGTAYLSIPEPDRQYLADCPLSVNIFTELTLQHNQFAAWKGYTSNASLSIYLNGDNQIPRSQFELLSIDASRNWWGDANGPYLCCNLKGKGSYASQLIRQDHWCLDPDCTSYSDVVLPVECTISCCPQKLSTSFVAVFVSVSLPTYLVLLIVLIFNIIRVRRDFSSKAFQYGQREDLIENLVPMLYQSVIASFIGCIGTLILGIMIGTLFKSRHEIPRQEKLPLAGIIYVVVFLTVVLIQLVSTTLTAVSILLRKRFRSMLLFLSSKQFFLNAFVVIYMLVIALIWGPYSIIFQPICHKSQFLKAALVSDSFASSYDSGHATLIAVLILPMGLTAIAMMVPQHTLNNLLYRYEYASINYVLEASLLKDLAKAPEVTKKARRLRISAIISLILIIANTAACIYALTLPLVPPREASNWPFTFAVWGKPRVINLTCICILGILTMAGTIGLSFSYNRALVINVLSAVTILVVTSVFNTNIFEWAGLIFLEAKGIRAFLLKGAVQVLGFLVIVSFMTTWVLLLKLKSAVTDELPKLAVSNLNSHLDESWHLSTHSQDTPLLTTSQTTDYESQ